MNDMRVDAFTRKSEFNEPEVDCLVDTCRSLDYLLGVNAGIYAMPTRYNRYTTIAQIECLQKRFNQHLGAAPPHGEWKHLRSHLQRAWVHVSTNKCWAGVLALADRIASLLAQRDPDQLTQLARCRFPQNRQFVLRLVEYGAPLEVLHTAIPGMHKFSKDLHHRRHLARKHLRTSIPVDNLTHIISFYIAS